VGGDFFKEADSQAILSDFKVVAGLEVHPELGGGVEEATEAEGGIGGDSAFAEDDFVDAAWGYVDGLGEAVLAEGEGCEEFLGEDFARMDGGNFGISLVHSGTSMVIDQRDIVSTAIAPDEANAPLVVDANAVLAGAIAVQCFEPVARWRTQIQQLHRSIQHVELSQGRALQIRRDFLDLVAMKQRLGLTVGETRNHAQDHNALRY
jgi:hypothetical protein